MYVDTAHINSATDFQEGQDKMVELKGYVISTSF